MDNEPADESDRFSVTDDVGRRRFELRRGGELVGFATYHRRDDTIVVPHVETIVQYRGQGYGARLVDGMLDIVRARGERIVPVCPFAADHIQANPRHRDLLA